MVFMKKALIVIGNIAIILFICSMTVVLNSRIAAAFGTLFLLFCLAALLIIRQQLNTNRILKAHLADLEKHRKELQETIKKMGE